MGEGLEQQISSDSKRKKKRGRANIRRQLVLVACARCREKKTKCDGRRPICTPCKVRNAQVPCSYDAEDGESRTSALKRENEQLKASLGTLRESFSYLQAMPDDEAVSHLQDVVRSSQDPLSTMSNLPRILSAASLTPRRTVSSSHMLPLNWIEYELTAGFPTAYPFLQPLPLGQRKGDRAASWAHFCREARAGAAVRVQYEQKGHVTVNGDVGPMCPPRGHAHDRLGIMKHVHSPRQASKFFHVDLASVDFAYWTCVPAEQDFFAMILPLYFEAAHAFAGFFDAQLFLDDLVAGKERYCSRLLVNAVLYTACLYGSTSHHAALRLKPAFANEAERLWEAADDKHNPMQKIAASLVLTLAFTSDLDQRKGDAYFEYSVELAASLDIACHSDAGSERFRDMCFDDARAQSYAAWGLFTFQTFRSFHYRHGSPTRWPNCPVPTEHWPPKDDIPYYVGSTFATWCRFSTILLPVTQVYCHPSAVFSLADAESKYLELLQWSQGLEETMARKENLPHHVLWFHTYFHTAIMDIFRPFLGQRARLHSFTAISASPEAVFAASLKQLKHMAVVFHHTYPEAAYAIQWHHAVLYIFNAVLRDSADPDFEFYLMLCIHSYFSLAQSWRTAKMILSSIFGMAVQSKRLPLADAISIWRLLPDDNGSRVNDHTAAFVLDQNRDRADSDVSDVRRLASDFQTMTMYGDFTTVE